MSHPCGSWELELTAYCFVIAFQVPERAVVKLERHRVMLCVYGATYSIRKLILNSIQCFIAFFLNQCLADGTRVASYYSATVARRTASKVPLRSPFSKLSRDINNSKILFCVIFRVFQNRVTYMSRQEINVKIGKPPRPAVN